MNPDLLAQNPFAVLTLIVAPAVLTNATSVLALSTSNRFLRAGERMRALGAELAEETKATERSWRLTHLNRIERQAVLLLLAIRAAYVALGSFVTASLVSIVGAGLASRKLHPGDEILLVVAAALGFVGAAAIVIACIRLFHATQLSMLNISEEAAIIRARESDRTNDAQ
jgi:uncharacterized membrane protein YgcG